MDLAKTLAFYEVSKMGSETISSVFVVFAKTPEMVSLPIFETS